MDPAPQDYPAVGESVGAARRYAAQVLDALDLPQLRDDVRTLVSELATNAVLHARTPFTVALGLRGERLRITVSDGSAARPRPTRLRDAGATTGRGLHLVADLSTAWGVEVVPVNGSAPAGAVGGGGGGGGGKAVWCELPLHPGRERGADASEPGEVDVEALLAAYDDLEPGARGAQPRGSAAA